MPTLKYRDPADGLWKPVDGFVQPHPMAMITSSAAQTLTTAVVSAAALDTVVYDTGGMTDGIWSLGSQRLIAPLSGYYRHYAHSGFNVSTGGYRAVIVRKNGTTANSGGLLVGHTYGPPSNSQITAITQTSEPQWFNAGDYITMNILQTSGADLITTFGNSRWPSLALEYVGLVGPNGVSGASVSSLASTGDISIGGLSIPRGTLGYAQITASTTLNVASTAHVNVPGLSVTCTVGTGRRIRISFDGQTMSTIANDRCQIHIREGASILMQGNGGQQVTASSTYSLPTSVVLTPTAGSHTYNITLARLLGTGNANIYASSNLPAYILVEDIGV